MTTPLPQPWVDDTRGEGRARCEGRPCTPATCRWRCALEVIDELLGSGISGAEADLLLDLRWRIGRADDPEDVIRTFCEVRRTLEPVHYLALFRIRRWLEHHLEAVISRADGTSEVRIPVKLDFHCVEAIRRASLCAAAEAAGRAADRPRRLRFALRTHERPPTPGAGSRTRCATAGTPR